MRLLKKAFLHTCEWLGLFRLTQMLSAGGLHVLCYHGFEVRDECRFRPQLFISARTFEARLRLIQRSGFTVLPLDSALSKLRSNSLPPRALVITIDDGFKSTRTVAAPLLERFGMPATVYVTTYYVQRQVPVFRLAVQYLAWSAGALRLDEEAREVLGALLQSKVLGEGEQLMWNIIRAGEMLGDESQREQVICTLARLAGIDVGPIYESKLLSLMSTDDLQAIKQAAVDVQLHTHRHRFPADDEQAARREIEENRAFLRETVGGEHTHFCYPSGIFDPRQWPWLQDLAVQSATTCLPGINHPDTPRFGLRRFLDSESISAIEFRAELAGFNELLRKMRARLVGSSS